jgi:VWFA-related protein
VDGAPTDITVFEGEDAPVSAGIVVDNSASMAAKRQEVIAGALAFARTSNPKDEIFVVHFNSAVRFGLPEGTRFTGSIAELETAIAAFALGGTTAFYDALVAAELHFKFAAYSSKMLLTITDGGDNSSHATLADAIAGARDASIVIYPIGVFDENDRDRNPAVLEKLAEQTGGRAFFPERVSAVTETCVRIARDIREQYTLGFPGATDGKYHRIRLMISDPKLGPLKAHTRAGYVAMRPSGS